MDGFLHHLSVAFCLLIVFSAGTSFGQGTPEFEGQQGNVYTYARPGQATQTVYVWGGVDRPGIWRVATDTDLVELFSVVHPGGYGAEGTGTRTEIVFRINRSSGGNMQVAHEMQLQELLEMNPAQRPTLQGEDVIEVRATQKRKFSFSTVSAVIGTLSSVTLLVIRLARF